MRKSLQERAVDCMVTYKLHRSLGKINMVHYWNSGIHDDCIVFCVSAFPQTASKVQRRNNLGGGDL